jgi:thiol-disulfide isomerase/thioredoxin
MPIVGHAIFGDVTPQAARSRSAEAPNARDTRTTLGALGLVVALLVGLIVLPRLLSFQQGMVGREGPDISLNLVANGESLAAGDPAAVTNDHASVSLSQLRGKAVLLDFWATWCPPCRVEAPIVDGIARRWRDRGVVVVGVNTDTPDQGDPRAFALSHGLTYPIAHDLSGQAQRAYQIENLPTLVILSRAGRVIALRTGITDDAEIERLLRQATD